MAVIPATIKDIGEQDGSVKIISWAQAAVGDLVSDSVELPQWGDRSVQFTATTWGTGSVSLEGSNDGVVFLPLYDPNGIVITATANKLEQVLEITRYVRVQWTIAPTSVGTITLLARRANPMRA